MNPLSIIIKTSIVLVLASFLSGCFFKEEALISPETLNVESGDLVEVTAREGGKKYRWKQLSGINVAIKDKRSATLAFTAPTVTEKTELVFELKAKFDEPLRDQITIIVSPVLIINGTRLPPEPNEEENNATLVGVDVNNNGVRDDVERWVYQEYKDKHPVHIEIGMQSARTWEKIFTDPSNPETTDMVDAAIACEVYYEVYSDPILIFDPIGLFQQVRGKALNIPERRDAFFAYDKALSGGVYTLPKSGTRKGMCDFNTLTVTGE